MRVLVRAADRLLEVAAVILLLSLLACVVLGVFFRLVNDPLAWSDEMAQYFLVWTGFVGWVIATRKRGHIRIEVIAAHLPRLGRTGLEVLIQLAMMGFGLAMAWHSLRLIERNWDVEAVSLPIPTGLIYLPLPVVGLVVALQAAGELVLALRGRSPEAASPAEAIN